MGYIATTFAKSKETFLNLAFKITAFLQRSRLFLKSTDFSKAVILASAITFPIGFGILVGRFEIGLAMALGALLSSSSDVSGSYRHKNYGILLSAIIAVFASLIGGYLDFNSWLLLPVLGVIMFGISYLSVFGFRASLISFSGLFAMVLSFANISNVLEVYERALLIGVGGIWYLILTVIWHRLNPKGQTDQYLAHTFILTAQYLETRAKLIAGEGERDKHFRTLLELQTTLNENHETLRDILISARKTSGNSRYERKRLLTLIQLVDILELAMANPVNYKKMDKLMQAYPGQIVHFKILIEQMAGRLYYIAKYIQSGGDLPANYDLKTTLEKVREGVFLHKNRGTSYPDEGYLMLQNLYDYQEKQVENIHAIERLLFEDDLKDIRFAKKDEITRFITPQEYDPKILIENLSFKSSIFKHSLRLAVVVVIGYAIGEYFSLQNAYWILLTIIVIMRPNYGLTKTRSKQRTIGTLIGAAISVGIVFITQDTVLYAILAVISLVLAFAMVQKNYKTSAIFVTLSVVFVYALLEPNVLDVIQFRVLDTLIGAGLATLGNILLWPTWEFFGIKTVIAESIKANKNYFKEVSRFYENKGSLPTSYKLSRKQAFLAMGNLNAAFQRMTQEPKSKQKNLNMIYEMVALNHSFLSSLASMGTYIQNHTTTEASVHFLTFSSNIELKLSNALNLLENRESHSIVDSKSQREAEKFFDKKYQDFLREVSSTLNKTGLTLDSDSNLQETQLIYDQLKWLLEISSKLEKNIEETHLSKPLLF